MLGIRSFTGLRGLVAVIPAGLLPAVAPPVLAQQEPASQAGFWQPDRVESHDHDERTNPCSAWTYTGGPDRATATTRMVCGDTPWSGTFPGARSRPPDRLIPGDAREMTVRGAVTASHDGITEGGSISMDCDPARCGDGGSGGSVVYMTRDTHPGNEYPDSAEQTGTGIVPGFSPDEPGRGRQDFLETLSWRCRAEVARIESQFAAAGISAAAYATAHPAAVAEPCGTTAAWNWRRLPRRASGPSMR